MPGNEDMVVDVVKKIRPEAESWPGLSEQGSAKDKWILCRLFSRDADLGRQAGRA
jgi:hypothetical protein